MHEKDEIIYSRFLKQRDEKDLRTLFMRHREGLYLFLLGCVHSPEDAEELMMDAFALAASGTASFSGRSSFKTWLYAIGRNRARMFLRKKRGFFAPLEEAEQRAARQEAAGAAPEVQLLRKESDRELYLALETLPDDYRQVLYLLYFEGMSTEEACIIMRKTKKQVYNLTERGKKALRETLEKMGFDDTPYR